MQETPLTTSLRTSWEAMHTAYRKTLLEAMELRTFVVLYAMVAPTNSSSDLDTELARSFPNLWEQVQEAREEANNVTDVS